MRQQAERQRVGGLHVFAEVLGDALVRVVGLGVRELQTVMGATAEPLADIDLVEEGAPADAQHVGEIHLGQGDGDVHGGERHEDPQELIPEGVGVLVLEGVEEVAREEVEANRERHLGEVDADQHGQEHGADAALGSAHRAEQGNAHQAVGARLEIAVGDGHDGPDHRHEGEPVDEGREGAGADRGGDGRHVAGERLRHEAGSGGEQDGEQQHVGRRQHADEHAQEAGDAPREVDDRRRREGDDRQKSRQLAPWRSPQAR